VTSAAVLAPLRRLLESLPAEPVLVRAVGPWPGIMPDEEADRQGSWLDLEHLGARPYLEDVAVALRGEGVRPIVWTVGGGAHSTVPALAREEAVHLVARATHGRGGLTRFALGSVAAETVRHAGYPSCWCGRVAVPASRPRHRLWGSRRADCRRGST